MRHLALTALLAGLVPAAALAQVKAGPEFLVGTAGVTPGLPEVAMTRAGDFIVTWVGFGSAGGADVFGQRFDSVGAPQGAAFRANTFTTGSQGTVAVAAEAKGRFVVAWRSYGQDGSGNGIFAQLYAAGGAAAGAEFRVNSYTTGNQDYPEVAPAGTGFVVVWHGGDAMGPGVFGQRYEWSGAAAGAEFRIASQSFLPEFLGVATLPDAGFVVVWSGNGIFGRRYDASGAPLGPEFTIDSLGGFAPQVAGRPDGSFVTAWNEAGYVSDVFARLHSGTAPIGPSFRVNTFTTALQAWAHVATDDGGNFVIAWTGPSDGDGYGVKAQRFLASAARRGTEFQVNTYTPGDEYLSSVAADAAGNFVVAWADYAQDGIFAQRFGGLQPAALAVDAGGNSVLEPGETASVAPAWRNVNGAVQTFGGGASAFTGPAGPTYELQDATGSYGTVANGGTQACVDCYQVRIQAASRPVQHWDPSLLETITPDAMGQAKRWRLHVGGSFTDVPAASPFYRFVETLLHRGITGGCGATTYCPLDSVTREQMAVFLLLAKEAAGYAPPACTTPVFADVPASSPFCRWIEELARRGVTGGCGGGNYCPSAAVTREQMPVFVLRTLDPALTPPACTTPLFNDVPASSPFCRWIEELARRGIAGGCGGGNYCPTAPVTREQMAVFLTGTFGLTLYGP